MVRHTDAEIERQLHVLESLVALYEQGIGRADLQAAFAESYGRNMMWRTALRRLAELRAQDRVRAEGVGPATVYRAGPGMVGSDLPTEPGDVPVSRVGARLRALVRRPVHERTPVGYDERLIAEYIPGSTWYLPKSLRTHLRRLGRAPASGRQTLTRDREILGRLIVDLAWASSHIEGNGYSRLETQNLLEFGQHAEGRTAAEEQMILNHMAAIELSIADSAMIGLNGYTLRNVHAAISENLLVNPADEGKMRDGPLVLGGTTYTPTARAQTISASLELILANAAAIPDPLEQAFFMLVQVPYLQPFAGMNECTSRVAASIPLTEAGLVPLSFVDVPARAYAEAMLALYELRQVDLLRDLFAWAYERGCARYRPGRESNGEPDPIRLHYHKELSEVVRETVQNGIAPRAEFLRTWAMSHRIPEADLDGFTTAALGLLMSIHEGSAARYLLRPGEYEGWRALFHATRGG